MKTGFSEKEINTNYLLLVSIISAGLLVLFLLPREFLFLKPSLCIHYRLLGVPCPLCGSTRGIYSLLHLYLSSALKYNFNVFLLAMLFPIFVARIFNSSKLLRRIEIGMLGITGSGFILIYILRLAGILT